MRNLVFIDDNELLLKALSMLLSEYFDVNSFSSPAAALRYIENNSAKLDIIVSDFKMPEYNGIQVLEKTKNANPATIRILLTGYSDYALINESKDVYDLVLDKNIYKDENQLVKVIDELSKKRR